MGFEEVRNGLPTGWVIQNQSVYYPDGRETQRIGIVPDIEVKRTIKGVIEGRDELLEKAIEIINQEWTALSAFSFFLLSKTVNSTIRRVAMNAIADPK